MKTLIIEDDFRIVEVVSISLHIRWPDMEIISTHLGEEGLKMLEKINKASSEIVSEKCRRGAALIVMEDREIVEENMDWERCLFIGFISNKVAGIISDYYAESARKRYEYISSRIDDNLEENETAVLFIREGHMVQFPRDIEVFNVAPPALNDIHRWVRDQSSEKSS